MNIYTHKNVFYEDDVLPPPPNHGKPWTLEDTNIAIRGFLDDIPAKTIACSLNRTAYSVCLKLKARAYLSEDPNTGDFLYLVTPTAKKYTNSSKTSSTTQKEHMKTLQQQTLILGIDISKQTTDTCLQLIGQLQKKRKELSELGIDSSYVKKELEECNEAVKLVIKQLDSLNV